jgi:transglutaminase-like putative cysteine protease
MMGRDGAPELQVGRTSMGDRKRVSRIGNLLGLAMALTCSAAMWNKAESAEAKTAQSTGQRKLIGDQDASAASSSSIILAQNDATSQAEGPPPYSEAKKITATIRPDNLVDWLITTEIIVGTDAAAREMAEQKADVNDYFYSQEILEAATLKADGRRLEVTPENIITKIKPTEFSEIEHFRLNVKRTTIRFPDVVVGDSVVYTVKRTAKRENTPGGTSNLTAVDADDRYSSYSFTLDAPSDMKLQTVNKGGSYRMSKRGDRNIHEWSVAALPYQAPERGAVSELDRGPYFGYSSYADWNAVGKAYCERAEPMVAVTPEIAKLADEITRGRDGTRDRAEAIFDWVAANIRYVNIVLGAGGLVPRPAASVLSNRYGDCKDHATLMRALLAAKGIASDYAFINAGRPIYKAFDLPIPSFDHVIVYVPELDIYADPTAKYSTFHSLPDDLYDSPVLRCGSGKTVHTRTPPITAEANTVSITAELSLGRDGKVSGATTAVATGPRIHELKEVLDQADEKGGDRYMTEILRRSGMRGSAVLKGKVFADQRPSASITTAFSLDESLLGEDNARPAILGPELIAKPYLTYGAVFRDDRTRDFICIPKTYREAVIYHLPPGWGPEHLPKDVDRKGGPAEFTARYSFAGDTVRVERTFALRTSGSVCRAAMASEIGPVFNAAIRDTRERLSFVPADSEAANTSSLEAKAALQSPQKAEEAERAPFTRSERRQIKVLPGNLMERSLTTEILIATKEGVERMSSRMVPVSDEIEEVEIIEAATLKADGRRLDVPADKIVTRALGKMKPVREIIFPDVAPGDRVRYTMHGRQKQKRTLGEGFFLDFGRWRLSPEPGGLVSLDVPYGMKLHIANDGYKEKISQSDGRTLYEWEPEPMDYRPGDFDKLFVVKYVQRLQISTYRDWEEIGEAYCRPAEAASPPAAEISKLAEEIALGRSARLEQARAIFDWIGANINDTEVSLDDAGWVPNSPTSTLAKRQGNSNDRAALMRALLIAKGIDAHFVLANTFGRTSDVFRVPAPDFSKIIVYVSEFDLYLDAAESFATFGTLDEGQYGTQVLRCGPGMPALTFVPQSSAGMNSASIRAELTIDAMGRATGTTTIAAKGTSADDLKRFKSEVEKKGVGPVMEEKLEGLGLRGSARIETRGASAGEEASMALSFSLDENLLGEDIAQPVIVGPRVAARPWRVFERVLRPARKLEDFFCFPKSYRETALYHLPEGWAPKALPKDVTRSGGPAEFSARYKWNGETLEIERIFALRTTNSICPASLANDILPVVRAAEKDGEEERLTFVPKKLVESKQ